MATLINDIHRFLGFLSKKGTSRFFSPEQIDDATYFSSLQVFNKYFGLFEQEVTTGKKADNQDPFQIRNIPEALKPFLKTATLSTTSKEVALPGDYAFPISVFNGKAEIELVEKEKIIYRKKREISIYGSEKGKVSEDYQPFIKQVAIAPDSSKRAALPDDYVQVLGINGDNRSIEIIEHGGVAASKRRAKLIEQCREYPNIREDIQPFLRRAKVAVVNREVPLPDDYVHMVAVYSGGKEVYIINNENKLMFKRERVSALLKDLARENDGWGVIIKKTKVNLVNGEAPFPDDFVEHVYSYNATSDYEPIEPNNRMYRKNSVIVPPSPERPVCIKYNDHMEYLGSPVTEVTMDYVGLFFASIEQDKIRLENNITGDLDFIYISLPTATLYQDYIQLHNAGIPSINLTYLGMPVCFIQEGKIQFETELSNFSLNYLKNPARPKWAYTSANNRPVFDPANSVDLEWNQAQHLEIIKGALTYLGVAVEDGEVVSYFDNKKTTGT